MLDELRAGHPDVAKERLRAALGLIGQDPG
jgi:hypothetical protein